MLITSLVAPALPVEDLGRARKFYEDNLGLHTVYLSSSGVLYKCGGGTTLFIYEAKVPNSECIAAIFEVDNLKKEVRELQSRGIVFQGDIISGAKILDDLTSYSTGNVTCFRDSEGNILALVQIGKLLESRSGILPF